MGKKVDWKRMHSDLVSFIAGYRGTTDALESELGDISFSVGSKPPRIYVSCFDNEEVDSMEARRNEIWELAADEAEKERDRMQETKPVIESPAAWHEECVSCMSEKDLKEYHELSEKVRKLREERAKAVIGRVREAMQKTGLKEYKCVPQFREGRNIVLMFGYEHGKYKI